MRGLTRLAGLSLLLVVAGCGQWPGTDATNPLAGSPAASPAMAMPPVAGRVLQGFASSPDRGELAVYQPALTRRDGAYTWHRADLSEQHALHAIADGHLRVRTPSGELLDIQYDHATEHPSGDWTWVGHVAGHADQQTILTFGERAAFGTIGQPDGPPLRLTVRDGVSWIVETDPAKIAGIDNAATRPTRPDYHIPPKSNAADGFAHAELSTAQSAPATASATTAPASTVDLVLGYTPGFASYYGGTSAAITRLNYLVDVANASYLNSQVSARARLVATVAVSYPDNTSNDTTLDQLTGYDSTSNSTTTADPAFNALRAAREQYGADLVSMVRSFREPENGGCGVGWLIGGGQSGISASDAYYGYSVVSDGSDAGTDGHTYFCLDETLTHELGHNMGAQHDVDAAKGTDGRLDPGDYGAFAYSFGYKNNTYGFYTVMAYGDSGQSIYRIFSDPRSAFCGGQACGTASADNARTLAQTIPIVATFRATVVPATPPPSPRVLLKDLDANGNGMSDLLLRSHSGSRVVTWFMSGTTRVAYQGYALAGGYVLVGTGDFNGDHRTDLLWTSSAHDLVMSVSGSSGYANVKTMYSYAAGIDVLGAADVNGNGKADILFRNPSTGTLYVWFMDGTTRVAYNAQAMPATYAYVGSGDLNKDGRQDLAWSSDQREVVLSLSAGTAFNTAPTGLFYSSDYDLVGVSDVNGNGTADLLFRNTAQTSLVTWFMDGVSRVAYSVKTTSSQYRLVGKGDFNGDHRGDLVWTDGSGHILLSLSTGTTFADSLLPYTYTSDYVLMDAG